ncbi:MAG: substrate-binding domain-containing protein [Rhodanobacteraceae bacterium]
MRFIQVAVVAALAAAGMIAPAFGAPAATASTGSAPIEVGVIYSKTGPLSAYGEEYRQGFEAGLAYVSHGTGKIDGHPIKVNWQDGAGNPAQAVSEAKTLIGQGYRILAGPTDSGVALQVAAVAGQNKVLFISGPAAADAISGINKYTFRSGRQSYQDVKTAAAIMGSVKGKHILVFAQNYAFGQANVAAVKSVLGGEGAVVTSLLVPLSTTDFTPFALKIKNAHPDMLFVAWAGNTTDAMWKTLDQQGVFGMTKVVTGLAQKAAYNAYGGVSGTKIDFLSYYFPQAPHNAVNTAMIDLIKKAGGTPDLFSPDGFVAAQMIAHAIEKTGGDQNVDAMIKALDGWTFEAPKGQETIRAQDHAMLQVEYIAKLVKQGSNFVPELVKTVSAAEIAPPLAKR